ncbi:MAG TPA: aldo/keto reductase [Polyangiaceae bacterium]|jgi:aryl-alcohol dehydrogenase-like predicted oxidoreductase
MNEFAHGPDTITLGDLKVRRLGFGAMRLPGKDVWGEPDSPERAKAVLRRVVDLGIQFVDTAWFYGPDVANRLIAETLHPYPRDLVIATKLGGRRLPDKGWAPFIKPEELREGLETDLRQLRLERIDVVHLRFMPVAGVPFLEAFDALREEQKRGRIRHIALSNVGTKEILAALERSEIVGVQNAYNVGGGKGEFLRLTHAEVEQPDDVLDLCTKRGIAYIPFFPLAVGQHERVRPALATIAKRHGATPAQIALAWLLARSPAMLPIPGTSSPEHVEENWAARKIELTADEVATLAAG